MTANIEKNVKHWYHENIKPKEMDDKIKATLEYIKRFNDPDDNGDWVVFAYEVVDGHHGQFTVNLFLDKVEGKNGGWEFADIDIRMEAFDEYGRALAEVFRDHSHLKGKFYVGHNEADGSLGVFYYERAY